jgi:hypothetical protein
MEYGGMCLLTGTTEAGHSIPDHGSNSADIGALAGLNGLRHP